MADPDSKMSLYAEREEQFFQFANECSPTESNGMSSRPYGRGMHCLMALTKLLEDSIRLRTVPTDFNLGQELKARLVQLRAEESCTDRSSAESFSKPSPPNIKSPEVEAAPRNQAADILEEQKSIQNILTNTLDRMKTKLAKKPKPSHLEQSNLKRKVDNGATTDTPGSPLSALVMNTKTVVVPGMANNSTDDVPHLVSTPHHTRASSMPVDPSLRQNRPPHAKQPTRLSYEVALSGSGAFLVSQPSNKKRRSVKNSKASANKGVTPAAKQDLQYE